MKTAAGALILALVLLMVGAVCLNEMRLTRRLVQEQQRLSTLHYDEEGIETQAPTLLDRVSLPFSPANQSANEHATISYWRGRYETLTPLTGASGERQTTDSTLLLIAANATYRSNLPDAGNMKAAVERLDSVIQAYGDVLRGDPNNVDAAFNYEYVTRVRDAFAKGKPIVRKEEKTVALSTDLPVGPTPHGRPGGPPPEVAMKDFKTYQPLQDDERGELIQVGRQPVTRRKG